jgi:ribonuclease HI
MLPKNLKVFFDGSCEPKNPGGVAGYGFCFYDEKNNEIFSDSGIECSGENATNNIAEWAAIKHALEYLEKNNWNGELEIYGDSQLVIYQLTGKYKVKKETLKPYHESCMEMLSKYKWLANWIPREKNEKCDSLSKKGNSMDK